MELFALDNIDVVCSDLAKMADFYHGVLGLPYVVPHSDDKEWFAVQAGHVTLYFFVGIGTHPTRQPALTWECPPGLSALALATEDLEAALGELEGKVEWLGERREWTNPDGTHYSYQFFYDPEGNRMSITMPERPV